jgi:hypothetical protein
MSYESPAASGSISSFQDSTFLIAMNVGFRCDRIRGFGNTLSFSYFTLSAWATLANIENAFGAPNTGQGVEA